MSQKIFIICLKKDKALEVAKRLVSLNDDLTIAPMFTTDEVTEAANENYEVYMKPDIVNLSYKNNALLFIKTNKYISTGITSDDFLNNDVCIMNVEEYNIIPDNLFNKYDILNIWIDVKTGHDVTNADLVEMRYFSQSLENKKYLYFLEGEPGISEVINEYINADEEEKMKIFEENC